MNSLRPVHPVCKFLSEKGDPYPFRALKFYGLEAVKKEIKDQSYIWLPEYRGDNHSPPYRIFKDLDVEHSVQGIVSVIMSQIHPMEGWTVKDAVSYGFEIGKAWTEQHPFPGE